MICEPMFFVVWCVDGGSPTVKHAEFATARKEAQRLARANPGRTFAVCAAAIAYKKHDLEEVRFEQHSALFDEEIPF